MSEGTFAAKQVACQSEASLKQHYISLTELAAAARPPSMVLDHLLDSSKKEL
jgi:hypothetical protein